MNRKIVFGAFSALALTVAAPVLAETPCQNDIKQVQAAWDKMYPMGMGLTNEGGFQSVTDAFRLAKEACQAGNPVAVQTNLNVVRAHLDLPQHGAPHDRKG